ncbi:sodium:proton symporter [Burkholderia gladioli]|nr:sodium:proton symporter [Burkholderia gladioli]
MDSDLYFYTVVREFQALLEVRRYDVGSDVIERRQNGGFDASTVRRAVFTTFAS